MKFELAKSGVMGAFVLAFAGTVAMGMGALILWEAVAWAMR
jgi:hypothetical protein